MIPSQVPRRGRPPLDLIGQRFGRLVVIERAPTLLYSRWRCLCDCGAECVVTAQLLRMGEKGGTRSCGCLRRERCRENGRRFAALMAQRRAAGESTPAPCTIAEVWR